MDRVPSHPVLSCAEAKAWEKNLLSDENSEWVAMQRAGVAVAEAVAADFREIGGFPEDTRILVLAGKGHNGGDALLAARALLSDRPEARVVVVLCFGAEALRPLAVRCLDWLRRDAGGRVEVMSAEQALASDQRYALCLDGVFGFQFRAPMDAATLGLLSAVNEHRGIRLRAAVDLPSGVGETNADTVFRADFTYATGIVKEPVLSARITTSVGRLRYLDLGFFALGEPGNAKERVLTTAGLGPLGSLRSSQSDKRTFGHLLVVGGSRSYPGAVVLTVRAALRSGAGLVTAFVPERLAPEYAARHPEAMWVGCPETLSGGLAAGTGALIRERLPRATALLIGPGLGAESETIGWVAQLAADSPVPLVLDADALRAEVVAGIRNQAFVCTPHAGEFQRIAPRLFVDDKLAAPRGVLVLKGPMTRITDGNTIYHSPFGGPVLARGGSGDILAGLIGGLLAQAPGDPLLAACRGTVWHGRAADLLARTRGQVAVELSEILEQLGPALIS
ncbi:MAG: ADP-dependent NAD(P)H-hydrate dehydratase / NAD(P)H-hydrate epimerase [Verrucomicrobiota bacterium]|nr:ADP-dependent NAD(P)H-hydrate dehydratase / NAD(P)H-hydrate epimerase [Verrucomicrobiota bacterium]